MRSIVFPCSLLLMLAASNSVAAADDRPNVILFIADDVSWNDYGCYGGQSARTPNIDALAANGLRFDNAYLTASSCSPSRCSIITGRYPHNNGQACELHGSMPYHLMRFPSLLRQAKYYTVLSGKNHMPQDKPPKAGDDRSSEPWVNIDGGKSKNNSGGHANWVSHLENRPQDRPFFCWYASYDAHRGWDGDLQWHPQAYGEKHAAASAVVPPFLVDNDPTRDDLASYENEVTRFDHFIGLTVTELKKQGVFDNTLIFVMADNGRPFPRAKTRLHDSGMKTALIAHWPAGIKSGSVSQSTVSAIDLAPTILDVAGVQAPESFQGVSMRPIFSDPKVVTRRYAFSEHNWHDYEAYGRSVRADGFLYLINRRPYAAWQGPADSVRSPSHQSLLSVRKAGKLSVAQQDVFLSPRPAVELYNVKDDPQQLNNLAGNEAHATTETRLAALLARWQQETGDSVPEKLTPDTFHRETGDRILKSTPRGTPPGFANKADQINVSGPIR